MKQVLKLNAGIILSTVFLLSLACNPQSKNKDKASEATDDADVVVIEEDYWIIEEYEYDDIPLVAVVDDEHTEQAASPESQKKTSSDEAKTPAEQTDELEMEYESLQMEALEADLMEQEYEVLASTVEETDAIIPLEETQSMVSYAKKGKNDAALQVVTNLQTGEVEQITFLDKNHKDVYDVQAGLTGKEVRKLRREVKHMVKKGQVFLYDDQSNIMYLMDTQNMVGDEVTLADIESMEVAAIIWKDKKKHHKK